jgi:hypothetical protein
MFEINMDEYLDEEVESVKQAFEVICKGWDKEVSLDIFSLFSSGVTLYPHTRRPNK